MTFQAYLDNIHTKTGKWPADFRLIAQERGLMGPDVKAGSIVSWLKADFNLGHGHAMAVWCAFQNEGWVPGPKTIKTGATK